MGVSQISDRFSANVLSPQLVLAWRLTGDPGDGLATDAYLSVRLDRTTWERGGLVSLGDPASDELTVARWRSVFPGDRVTTAIGLELGVRLRTWW